MTFFAKLTRRGLLKVVAGTIGAFFISQYSGFSWKQSSSSLIPEETLWRYVQQILVHPESAMAIGKKYLQCRSCEADARQLSRLIVPEGQESMLDGKGGLVKFRSNIRKRIQEDFINNQTVMLDGWILSLTEVRLCSLVTMKNGGYMA